MAKALALLPLVNMKISEKVCHCEEPQRGDMAISLSKTRLLRSLCSLAMTGMLALAPVSVYGASIPLPTPLAANVLSTQIGIAAAVRGTVKISNNAQVGKIVSSGESIFLGDEVTTDGQGNLQILLLDETTFTIGPNSAIIIDKFIYDPSTHDGEVKAKVVKGVFRFVTGKIGQKKPQQMEVELPSGTIGIRGTIVAGEVNGKKSTIMLLGPGERNNTGHRQGSFVLSNDSGGQIFQETVNKTGFGSTIEGEGQPPTKPFQVPAEQMNKITNALGPVTNPAEQGNAQPGNDPNGSDNRSATDQSGQGKFQGREFARQSGEMGKIFQKLESESNEAAQEIIQSAGTHVFNGPTSRNQLQGLASFLGSGVHQYRVLGVPLTGIAVGGNNNVDFYLDINFGGRFVGGGNSRVVGQVSLGNDFTYNLNQLSDRIPFGVGTDSASYTFTTTKDSGNCTVCQNAKIDLNIGNIDGGIARASQVSVEISDGSFVPQAQGSAVAPKFDNSI